MNRASIRDVVPHVYQKYSFSECETQPEDVGIAGEGWERERKQRSSDGPTSFLLCGFCGYGGLWWRFDFAEVGEWVGVSNVEDGHLRSEG